VLYFIPRSYLLPSKSKPTRALFCMGEVRRKKSINFRSTPHRRKFGPRLRYHSSLGMIKLASLFLSLSLTDLLVINEFHLFTETFSQLRIDKHLNGLLNWYELILATGPFMMQYGAIDLLGWRSTTVFMGIRTCQCQHRV